MRQDAFKARDKLNKKSYYNPILILVNWRKQGVNPAERLNGTDSNK